MTRIVLLLALFAGPALAQDPPAWTRPTAPFRVVGPIHYVGTEGLAAYLIETSRGLILIDGTMEENVPAIERSIAALGFRLKDVKLLLNSHAHFDHAAGLAKLKADSGAALLASPRDRPALESGRPIGETSYGEVRFPAVKVDRVLADGRPVRLGDVTLIPTFTPGHTTGCTTWSMKIRDGGRLLDVVFPCSITVAGNRLVGNRGYPGIVANFHASFRKLARMHADVVLPAHPEAADMLGRKARRDAGDRDAMLMPGLLPKLVRDAEAAFEVALAKEQAASR
ncbi:subclass B3 metallo-beta-lactamase [Sphingomonas sp. 1P06PA]|uniref:subclass B3 metallo-beta-lactamase n=1 Tax=Sphingomonas sp. 1P06PA TaxID=554121 RepID=UPI0039A4D29D